MKETLGIFVSMIASIGGEMGHIVPFAANTHDVDPLPRSVATFIESAESIMTCVRRSAAAITLPLLATFVRNHRGFQPNDDVSDDDGADCERVAKEGRTTDIDALVKKIRLGRGNEIGRNARRSGSTSIAATSRSSTESSDPDHIDATTVMLADGSWIGIVIP